MARLGPLLPAVGLLGLSLSASLVAGAAPSDPRVVAVVFPPWWSPDAIMAAASSAGDVVASGRLPFIVVVRSDDGELPQKARDRGALLILDRSAFGRCLA